MKFKLSHWVAACSFMTIFLMPLLLIKTDAPMKSIVVHEIRLQIGHVRHAIKFLAPDYICAAIRLGRYVLMDQPWTYLMATWPQPC